MSIKALLTQILKRLNMAVVYNDNSATVNAAGSYTVASVTIPANSRYLMLSHTSSSINNSGQLSNAFAITGSNYTTCGGSIVRCPMTNGGGLANWCLIETGSTSVIASVTTYGYVTTSHTEYGRIIAIPIFRGGYCKKILSTSWKGVAVCL